ncbi:MAG: hypothetical protein AVDCRST_MAG16-1353, partial [uncultured Frankineae bacterium]
GGHGDAHADRPHGRVCDPGGRRHEEVHHGQARPQAPRAQEERRQPRQASQRL